MYLNFGSFLLVDYKNGLIATLLHRTYTICSDYGKLHDEIKKLKIIWQKNDFPLFFIDKCIKKFLDKIFIKKVPNELPTKKEFTVPLVFLGRISIQIKKKLQSAFRELCPGLKLKVVFSSPNRIRNGFMFKDRLPRELDSMCLYKFSCGVCNCTYIGETKRHFQVRSYEHMGTSLFTNNQYTYNSNNATAIHKHSYDFGHETNARNFNIVGHASNKFHLRLKEAFLISLEKPTLINVQKKDLPLKVFGV